MVKQLGVLIDFTDLCYTSVNFAKSIAKKAGAKVSLIHVAKKNEIDTNEKFLPFVAKLQSAGLDVTTAAPTGNFEKIVPGVIAESRVEMVVVGTHGVVGIRQHLFGANILKLVKHIGANTLVVQEKSVFNESHKPRILFPVSPQENFPDYVGEIKNFASLLNAEVLIYTIVKSDLGPGEEIERNKEMAAELLAANGIGFQIVDDPASVYSYGFGKQIVEFANSNSVDFISINSKPASNLAVLADADKELIIINKYSIPVFCFNK